jgi:acyl-[acyl-carrier-protein]-phospholipid O-acyltransferase/long-chain-fatty-acid--[acyl-carrier-protein] ligase
MQYHIKPQVLNQKNVGILLPAGIGGVLANLVLLCLGKTVVNLNFTSSLSALEYAIKDSNTYTIITSRVFVEKLIQRGYDLSSILAKTEVVYLEDFKKPTSKIAIIRNFIMVHLLPLWVLKLIILTGQDNNATAAILFSSGSEGKPKGIELTHRNILGNIKQVTSVFNIREDDVILSTLPLFHAFGLTVTTFMPLCEGTPMICHPDPTDAVKIGKLIYQHRVTVMCGTSTFFGLYNRNRQLLPQMFESLRLVIAGAEKLNEQIRKDFKLKFNKDIYEGYGATEVAPVASSNLPDELDARDWHLQIANRIGSVGLPLPGTAFKIVDPSTLEELPMGEEGMVLIGGTQVMNGYLNNPTKTKEVLIPDGDITWYVTGDKGRVDEDGYLTIVDRYSRFAKIGGEMISLSLVEQAVSQVFPDASLEVMALSLADDKKGEKIILLHTGELNRSFVRENLLRQQLSPLYIPAEYISVAELPKLGSGKKDYVNAKKWLLENQEICSA